MMMMMMVEVSSISKETKVKTGMNKWDTLKTKYNLIELELKNNIIRFSYKDIEFYLLKNTYNQIAINMIVGIL